MRAQGFEIRLINDQDRKSVEEFIQKYWGSLRQVRRGKLFYPADLPGFVAVQSDKLVGLIGYDIDGGDCEIAILNSVIERIGIGAGLIDAVKDVAISAGCRRLWLITTNDNLNALRFYQKRGMRLAAVYPNALDESRKLKPEIPAIGMDGIPLRDEIELEMALD